MNLKTITLVIIAAIFVGITIVFFLNKLPISPSKIISPNSFIPRTDNEAIPSPSSKPSLPPISETTNLKEEINKLNPPDYSGNISNLKQEVK